MLDLNKFECLWCGKPVPQKQGVKRILYCNSTCRDRYKYRAPIGELERNRLLLYPGNTRREDKEINPHEFTCLWCASAVPQTMGARRIMYCNRTCRSRYWQATPKEERDHNRELLRAVQPKSASRQEYTCKYCGKSFEGYIKKPRNYCSRSCSYAAHSYEGDGCRVDSLDVPAGSDLCEKALRMHSEGILTAEIARQLGCPSRTVALWINHGKKLQSNPAVYHKMTEPHFRYIYASNADIWIKVLRDEMNKTGAPHTGGIISGRYVRLICGTINTHKSADNLAAIVASKFGLDPFDGGYFAFCGKSREYIRYIRWDGGGFQMTMRQRERGLYVWPPMRLGMPITVTAEEFEFILSGSNAEKIQE